MIDYDFKQTLILKFNLNLFYYSIPFELMTAAIHTNTLELIRSTLLISNYNKKPIHDFCSIAEGEINATMQKFFNNINNSIT